MAQSMNQTPSTPAGPTPASARAPETMSALLFQDGALSYREDLPRPVPGAGEALIQVRLAGICSTDLEITAGYGGFQGILGHEFVGTVTAVGATADAAWVGRRVVGEINVGCTTCAHCAGEAIPAGAEHCPNRTVVGILDRPGVFAQWVTLPVRNLHAVPDSVPDEAAVFAEPLAAALRVCEQVTVPPTARVAVVGPGRLGLLIAQVVARTGADVLVLGRREASLSLPRELGLAAGLVDHAAASSFDLAVEATGNDAGLAHALRLLRPQGTLVMKSTFAGKAHVDLTRLVVDEITVVGSRCGPFAPALRLLAEDAVHVQPLVDAAYPLAQAPTALAHAAQPGTRKVLLHIPPS